MTVTASSAADVGHRWSSASTFSAAGDNTVDDLDPFVNGNLATAPEVAAAADNYEGDRCARHLMVIWLVDVW